MAFFVSAKNPATIKVNSSTLTFVTGPSQYLGLSHMIFGDEDRAEYLKRIRVNMENFYEILGLPYNKNLYYSCFNLMDIPGCTKQGMEPEELFVGLAKKGVVLIPANLFFSEKERSTKDCRMMARASLPNLTFSNLQRAAKLIKEYMTS